jgi:hypothetical protein
MREGFPTPSMTFEIREWRGLIVVTTLISALAEKLNKEEINAKNIDLLMKFIFITYLCCYIITYVIL